MPVWRIPSRLALGALLVLVTVDVALVAAALQPTSAGSGVSNPSGSGSSAGGTAGPSGDPSLSTSANTSGTSGTSGTPGTTTGAPLRIMLSALDNKHAWRAAAGSCSAGGGTLLTTRDGGKTWTRRQAQLRRIVRVQAGDAAAAFVVGANVSCAPQVKDTADGGDTWAGGGNVGQAWFRDPANARSVVAPGLPGSAPCGRRSVFDLAVVTGSARVLCSDGRVRSTQDGALWSDAGKASGAVALAVLPASTSRTYVARLGAPDCAGVQILRVGQRLPVSCIRTSLPAEAGQIALALTKGGGWLAVGSTTLRSTDDLVTWRVSSESL